MATILLVFRSCAFFLTSVCLLSSIFFADAGNSQTALPPDANEAIHLAAKSNGLAFEGGRPWHVKASYKVFDRGGKTTNLGTFEEWWLAPGQYKSILTDNDYSQTVYRNGKDIHVTGNPAPWPPQGSVTAKYINHPFVADSLVDTVRFGSTDFTAGSLNLKCFNAQESSTHTDTPSYCLQENLPVLRVEKWLGRETLFNNFVSIGGHYLAKSIQVIAVQKPELEVTVDSVEYPSTIGPDITTSPESAFIPQHNVFVAQNVIAGHKIKNVSPEYPYLAKENHVQGTVILNVFISTNGKVQDVRVMDGPEMLLEPAIQAVKQWQYTPYLLDGKAVTVETEIRVIYHLN